MIAKKNRKKNLCILSLVFCSLFFLPIISEPAYKVYLKNGRVMAGVDEVEKDAGMLKIYKNGVTLELPETSVTRIEEYGIKTPEKKTTKGEETPEGQELPEYLRYLDKNKYYDKIQGEKIREGKELQKLKNQYQSILNKLESAEALEKNSTKLKKRYYRSLKKRKYRLEKSEIVKELKEMNKDSLLEQKKELESRIDSLERK
jgi:hypothetical protein